MTSSAFSVLPDKRYIEDESRKEREPLELERCIYYYITGQYQIAKQLNSVQTENLEVFSQMALGRYVRRRGSTSRYKRLYIPQVQNRIRRVCELIASRAIPNAQAMNFFTLESAVPVNAQGQQWLTEMSMDQFLVQDQVSQIEQQQMQQDAIAMQMGMPPNTQAQMVSAEKLRNVIVTMALRSWLSNSNLMETFTNAMIWEQTYGDAVVFPRYKTRTELVPAHEVLGEFPEFQSVDEEGNVTYRAPGIVNDMLEFTDPDTGVVVSEKVQYMPMQQFDRFDFWLVDPANMFVPDLQCEGGISALPGMFFWNQERYIDLWKGVLVKRGDGKRLYGSFPRENLMQLRPSDETYPRAVPLDVIGGDVVNNVASGNNSVGTEWGDQANAVRSVWNLKCPYWVGCFSFSDIPEFQERSPSPSEIKQFRKKFGISALEWIKPGQIWVIQWCEERQVLLRFEPWRLPLASTTGKPYVHSRFAKASKRTFGRGVYQQGAADEEMLYNTARESELVAMDAVTSPVYTLDTGQVDKRTLQILSTGGIAKFEPNAVILLQPGASQLTRPPLNPIETMSFDAIEAARLSAESSLQNINFLTSYSEDIMGASSGRQEATATEVAVADQNLNDAYSVHQRRPEDNILRPATQMALDAMIQFAESNGGFYRFTPQTTDIDEVSNPELANALNREIDVPVEILREGRYSIVLMTGSAGADAMQRGLTLERWYGAAMRAEPGLQMEGLTLNHKAILGRLAEANNIVTRDLIVPFNPMAMAGVGAQAGEDARAQGGKEPPPGPQEPTPPEMSDPGEPMPGQPVNPTQRSGAASTQLKRMGLE